MAQFGNVVIGGIVSPVTNFEHRIRWTFPDTPGVGTINFASVHSQILVVAGVNQLAVHLYVQGATPALSTLAFSSGVINVVNMVAQWNNLPMAGALVAGTPYIIDVQGMNSVGNRLRISSAATAFGNEQVLADIDFIAPANLAGAVGGNLNDSVIIDFTPAGAGPVGSPGVDIKRRLLSLSDK